MDGRKEGMRVRRGRVEEVGEGFFRKYISKEGWRKKVKRNFVERKKG